MNLDKGIYGIQAFDRPDEAFALLASNWSIKNEANMAIVNDYQFVRYLEARVITILAEAMLGKVSKEKCKESLGLETIINDYLLDWNFFLYSSSNNRFYTSLMEFKDGLCYLWCDRQWDIFEELYQTYRFNDLIDGGIMFVEEHQYLIDEYGDDGLEVMLDEYWSQ